MAIELRGGVVAFMIVVAGCGRGDSDSPTQVAARVNGDEITIHQINGVLARTPNIGPEQAERYKRRILERLIDQHLAKQQAVERKLDRNPRTVQALEAAKMEILARAYVEQIASVEAKPTAEQVQQYYADHPELFAERRLYSLEELIVSPKGISPAAVKDRVGKVTDLGEIASWLKSENAEVSGNRGVRAAEQLPLPWLAELHKTREGDVRVFENGGRLHVVRVAATRAVPVDEATARPRIEQFLANRRLTEAVAKEIQHLREKSNIEYMGEFAGASSEEGPATEPEAFQPQPPPSATPDFEKGIRGLR